MKVESLFETYSSQIEWCGSDKHTDEGHVDVHEDEGYNDSHDDRAFGG